MTDLLIMACFHEAGHAVAAYNRGYSCEKIAIDEAGDGSAIINYHDDEDIAISVLYDKPVDEYAAVNPEKERNIAKKVCRILISGLVSECILTHPLRNETSIALKQTGTDFLKSGILPRSTSLIFRMKLIVHVPNCNRRKAGSWYGFSCTALFAEHRFS